MEQINLVFTTNYTTLKLVRLIWEVRCGAENVRFCPMR